MFIKVPYNNISFKFKQDLKISKANQKKIDDYWECEKKTKPNDFNGEGYGAIKLVILNNKIEIWLCDTDYKRTKYALNNRPSFLCAPRIGLGIVFQFENKMYLPQKNNTGTYSSYISQFGGYIDKNNDLKLNNQNFKDYIKSEALREIREEVETNKKILSEDLIFKGIYIDEKTLDLDFYFLISNIKPIKLIDEENINLSAFSKEELLTSKVKINPSILSFVKSSLF